MRVGAGERVGGCECRVRAVSSASPPPPRPSKWVRFRVRFGFQALVGESQSVAGWCFLHFVKHFGIWDFELPCSFYIF